MKLNYIDETVKCFEIVKKLALEINFPNSINREIEKFYGNKSLGIFAYLDKFKMEGLIHEYQEAF